ncbi:MAG: replication-associated recombination protein A [Firmicutes bacterium]|nr:replication-associated recombination protein A [Bacillota bacterium]
MRNRSLADAVRPQSFDEMVGQRHLLGSHGALRRLIDAGRVTNMIFSGPAGTGKTTAAEIVAKHAEMKIYRFNATTATLSDVKSALKSTSDIFGAGGILIYLDEIQYFNKKQQQSLLEYIEDGRVTLIASTTENPYYSIYSALLSRCSVFEFKPVEPRDLAPALRRALDFLCAEEGRTVTASDDTLLKLATFSAGDVRHGITLLENAFYIAEEEIKPETFAALSSASYGSFDRDGDVHYDLLSALQKSIRGSDPDAAVFYVARLLAGGDILSVCRRLLVIASEDIGAAYPMAAAITYSCCEAAKQLGMPEAQIPLGNAAVMLATAPKSNTACVAVETAMADVEAGLGQTVPHHLHAPLFDGYKYPHDFPNRWVEQQYLPDDVKDKKYYRFGDNKTERAAEAYWDAIKKKS